MAEKSQSASTLNIYQKLIEVRKTVKFLKKETQGFNFKYASSSQILGSVRESMDLNGLMLIPRVVEARVGDHTTQKGNHEYFTQLKMTYTWVNADNPEETIECQWYGQGLDDGEKGVGKALTYAEKYFILKTFNIAVDKDDPDSNQPPSENYHQNTKHNDPEKTKATVKDPGAAASEKQIKAIYGISKGEYDYDVDQMKGLATAVIGKKIGSLDELTKGEASLIIETLNDKNAMAELTNSPKPEHVNSQPKHEPADDLPF